MNKEFELVIASYSQAGTTEEQVFSRPDCYLFEYVLEERGDGEISVARLTAFTLFIPGQ